MPDGWLTASAVERTVQRMQELRALIARGGVAAAFAFSRLAAAKISCRDALMCWAENCLSVGAITELTTVSTAPSVCA